MPAQRVVVVGAGVGGLATALILAARGTNTVLVERASTPGGKLRQVSVGGVRMDAGPTVFTLRSVFDRLLADAGVRMSEVLRLHRAGILARHVWPDGSTLDLFADLRQSADAIRQFAGAAEARRFLGFMREAQRVYSMLERPYLHSARPTPFSLTVDIGRHDASDLLHLRPFSLLWKELGRYFRDPRLQQLFGRYATYCGSSPFLAPATLMLIAHVEQDGVWLVEGGMYRVAEVLSAAATSCGAQLRFDAEVQEVLIERGRAAGVRLASGERIAADAVVVNADPAAIGAGLFGADAARAVQAVTSGERSLSALTWNMCATTDFPLSRHNVFFSSEYAAEFDDIFKRQRLPSQATVYVCAQDRDDAGRVAHGGAERLLCLVNAPATADLHPLDIQEMRTCEQRTFSMLAHSGLHLEPSASSCVMTTPHDFHRLFPATGGALYGMASHGWQASFKRPRSRTAIPGLYLAGGGTHPGPGVPMAALSGRLAAASVLEDWRSMKQWRRTATVGGTSTL